MFRFIHLAHGRSCMMVNEGISRLCLDAACAERGALPDHMSYAGASGLASCTTSHTCSHPPWWTQLSTHRSSTIHARCTSRSMISSVRSDGLSTGLHGHGHRHGVPRRTMIYFTPLLRAFACASRRRRRQGLCILPILASIILHDTGDQALGVSIGLQPVLVALDRFEIRRWQAAERKAARAPMQSRDALQQ